MSRRIRRWNSRRRKSRRSLAIVARLLFPVLRIAGATCVSALFGITFLIVLFDADHAGVLDFPIGGLVLEKMAKSESPGLMKNSLEIFPTI